MVNNVPKFILQLFICHKLAPAKHNGARCMGFRCEMRARMICGGPLASWHSVPVGPSAPGSSVRVGTSVGKSQRLITKKDHSSLQGILFSFIGFLKFQAAFERVDFILYAFTVFIQATKGSLLTFTHHEGFQWRRGKQIDITGTANDINMNININKTKKKGRLVSILRPVLRDTTEILLIHSYIKLHLY